MGIIKLNFKKKKKVPFRRIGLGLVPPAAFAVVPGYTQPKSIGPKTKGVRRFAAGSTAIAASIALPSALNEFDDSFDSFDSVSDEEENVIESSRALQQSSLKETMITPSAGATVQQSSSSARRKTKEAKSKRSYEDEESPHQRRPDKKASEHQMMKSSEELNENAATAVMKTNITESSGGDVDNEDEKLNDESMLWFMQKLIDRNASSSGYIESSVEDDSNRKLSRRRRSKRKKLRKLKSYVEERGVSSLEEELESDREAGESRGGRRGMQEKRLKRRQSVKKMKTRLMRSSVTSLEREFGSQLTFDTIEKIKRENSKTKRRSTKMKDRYNVVEESLLRALTELHYFQVEFGKSPDITKQAEMLSASHQIPDWLTDPEVLSPLFQRYDSKLKRKDDEIKILQENMSLLGVNDQSGKKANIEDLEESLNNLRQENSRLLSKCHEFSLQVAALQETLEKEQKSTQENALAIKTTGEELENALNDLSIAKKEKEKLLEETREQKTTITNLQEQVENSVPKTIHKVEIKGLKTEIEDVKERHDVEINNYKALLKTAQVEQANSQLETATVAARLAAAHNDIEELCLERSKTISEMDVLKQRNGVLMEQYESGQQHLANTIRVAERALLERLTFADLAEKEHFAAQDAFDKTMKEKLEMGRMEETLRQVKIRLATQTDEINDKLRQQEDLHKSEIIKFKREIENLKKQLEKKDGTINNLLENQRRTELELEVVCKSVADDTRLMIKDLHAS